VLLLSRVPILACGLLGLVLAAVLARRLAGDAAGLLAAAAWATYPEAAAQSVQATTDLVAAVAAMTLARAALVHFDSVLVRPRAAPRTHLALGAAVGLAALSKHTLLLPIVIVTFAAVWLRRARSREGIEQPPGAAARFVVAAAVAALVVWTGYLFEFGPIAAKAGGGHEHSATIARLFGLDAETVDRWVETVPVPAPTYWRSVADALLDKARARGGGTWTAYLDGEWSDAGFAAYFPVALLVKTPVALLLVIAAGLVGWRATRRDAGYAADLVLALFALPFVAAVASRLNIGVRHLLPAVPFALVLGCAALGRLAERRRTAAKALLALLGVALAVEWTANRFDPLPFANLPSGGPDRLHRRLADSNLEAGQDLWNLERWCEEHRVESIHVLLHDPQGLYEREAAAHPYLRPRAGMNPGRFVDPIVEGLPQTGDVPTRGLIALGESVIVRPLGYSRLVDVEPLARVGRTRIYRTTP
jgi:4-amino-4-deoxy-L-arabinose transferase-like glycosyltransferase